MGSESALARAGSYLSLLPHSGDAGGCRTRFVLARALTASSAHPAHFRVASRLGSSVRCFPSRSAQRTSPQHNAQRQHLEAPSAGSFPNEFPVNDTGGRDCGDLHSTAAAELAAAARAMDEDEPGGVTATGDEAARISVKEAVALAATGKPASAGHNAACRWIFGSGASSPSS